MTTAKATKIYQFIKEGHISFDGGHAIHTPQALVEEILSKLPLTGEILVLFNVEFVVSLVYTYGIDPASITFYSDHPSKVKLLQKIGVTKYLDTLDNTMKFDVAVLNPPYNDSSSTDNMTGNRRSSSSKLHVDFIEKALTIASTVAVICPLQGWWLGKGSKAKSSILANKQLQHIDFIPACSADKLFNATVGNVGILTLAAAGTTTTDVYYDGKQLNSVAAGEDPKLVESTDVVDILTALQARASIAHRVVVTQGPNRTQAEQLPAGPVGYVPIIGSSAQPLHTMLVDASIADPSSQLYQHRDYKINPNMNSYRVGINYAGTPRKLSAMKIIPKDVVVSRNVTTITAGSASQAQNLLDYLQTTFVRAIVAMSHTGKNNTKQTFKYVPDVDLTRSWTDTELYAHFNLTQEEIDLIEATIK